MSFIHSIDANPSLSLRYDPAAATVTGPSIFIAPEAVPTHSRETLQPSLGTNSACALLVYHPVHTCRPRRRPSLVPTP